ncbi:MAG: arsenate reductase ArsC [Zetaproteobacteria bacterium]|nr:arsenate reductase ArsC [Zetaproteobacteria bacterium]
MVNQPIYNLLFLSSGNACRGQFAECVTRRFAAERFSVFSAGVDVAVGVDPLALDLLAYNGYETEGLHTKTWDQFLQPDAPAMDFIITLSDKSKDEMQPTWAGMPVTAHWAIANPLHVESGKVVDQVMAYRQALFQLENRIKAFASLPIASLDSIRLKQYINVIGLMQEF